MRWWAYGCLGKEHLGRIRHVCVHVCACVAVCVCKLFKKRQFWSVSRMLELRVLSGQEGNRNTGLDQKGFRHLVGRYFQGYGGDPENFLPSPWDPFSSYTSAALCNFTALIISSAIFKDPLILLTIISYFLFVGWWSWTNMIFKLLSHSKNL